MNEHSLGCELQALFRESAHRSGYHSQCDRDGVPPTHFAPNSSSWPDRVNFTSTSSGPAFPTLTDAPAIGVAASRTMELPTHRTATVPNLSVKAAAVGATAVAGGAVVGELGAEVTVAEWSSSIVRLTVIAAGRGSHRSRSRSHCGGRRRWRHQSRNASSDCDRRWGRRWARRWAEGWNRCRNRRLSRIRIRQGFTPARRDGGGVARNRDWRRGDDLSLPPRGGRFRPTGLAETEEATTVTGFAAAAVVGGMTGRVVGGVVGCVMGGMTGRVTAGASVDGVKVLFPAVGSTVSGSSPGPMGRSTSGSTPIPPFTARPLPVDPWPGSNSTVSGNGRVTTDDGVTGLRATSSRKVSATSATSIAGVSGRTSWFCTLYTAPIPRPVENNTPVDHVIRYTSRAPTNRHLVW